MCRDGKGQPLAAPPIVRAIAKDPVLSKVLLQHQCVSAHNLQLQHELIGQGAELVRKAGVFLVRPYTDNEMTECHFLLGAGAPAG